MEPEVLVGSVQEVTSTPSDVEADTSPSPEASTHKDFDALPQSEKIKWLVAYFRLNDSRCCREIPTCGKRSSGCCYSLLTLSPLEDTGKLT